MAFSKIILNNTTLMDVTDTTATAEDVATGKYFYGVDGVKTAGTGSGGSPNLQTKTGITPSTSSQTIEADTGYDGLASVQINRIPTNYITTDDADATSSDILSGKTAYVNGSKITGEIYSAQNVMCVLTGNIDETTLPTAYLVEGVEIDEGKPFYTSNGKIVLYTPKSMFGTAMAADVLESKTFSSQNGLGVQGTIEEKSSTDLTASGATVTVPAGYYASQATKSVVSGSASTPATTISVTPGISVNSSGLITATASGTQSVTPTISAGYVSAGTAGTITVSGSNTSQLSTQAAATITPTESSQTAVAAGKYTTGAVTVGGISSTYIGSGITQRSSTDLTVSGASVTAPAGYYASAASKAVPFSTIYVETTDPTSSDGSNGDIWIKTEGS